MYLHVAHNSSTTRSPPFAASNHSNVPLSVYSTMVWKVYPKNYCNSRIWQKCASNGAIDGGNDRANNGGNVWAKHDGHLLLRFSTSAWLMPFSASPSARPSPPCSATSEPRVRRASSSFFVGMCSCFRPPLKRTEQAFVRRTHRAMFHDGNWCPKKGE